MAFLISKEVRQVRKKFIWQCDECEYVDNEAENDDEKLYLYIL